MASGGVFRYGYNADGHPAAWEADEPYAVAPYPISTRNLLGVHLQADGEPIQRVRLGAGRQQEIDPAAYAVRPGFAYHWGGLSVAGEGQPLHSDPATRFGSVPGIMADSSRERWPLFHGNRKHEIQCRS